MTPTGPGITQPNTLPFWISGVLCLIVFGASQSAKVRDRFEPLTSNATKLRRLEDRGVKLRDQFHKLPRHGVGSVDLAALRPAILTWARDCDAFALGLNLPSHQVDILGDDALAADTDGWTFYMQPESYVNQRMAKLASYVNEAHIADR